MTQQFQVGDIVRIDTPSQEDLDRLERLSFVEHIRDHIGSHAVVTGVSRMDGSVVTLLPCTEGFTFTVDTIPEMMFCYETKGIATHLTLVREGTLRSCTFSDDVSDVLSGAHLPLVGSTVNNHERVDGVHLFPWGVRIDVTSTDGTSSSIGITVPLIEPALPFTTF